MATQLFGNAFAQTGGDQVYFDSAKGAYYKKRSPRQIAGMVATGKLPGDIASYKAAGGYSKEYIDSPTGGQSAAASVLPDDVESAGLDEDGREQFRRKKLGGTSASAGMLGA